MNGKIFIMLFHGDYRAIVFSGDGVIKHNKRNLAKFQFPFVAFQTIGVGLIHKTDKIFFTNNEKEIFETTVPLSMKSEKLYPIFSMASRDDRLTINLGQ